MYFRGHKEGYQARKQAEYRGVYTQSDPVPELLTVVEDVAHSEGVTAQELMAAMIVTVNEIQGRNVIVAVLAEGEPLEQSVLVTNDRQSLDDILRQANAVRPTFDARGNDRSGRESQR